MKFYLFHSLAVGRIRQLGHIYFMSTFIVAVVLLIVLASITNAAECLSCHAQQHQDWLKSDHAKAMAKANETTVLGDFNKITAQHFSQKALFFRDKKQFKVPLTAGGRTTPYSIH